jgi:hypothetical protein
LHVYENGIGAINLPLPGGVGRDHSKAVHPISLIKIGEFVSRLARTKLSVENPFIFSTKAEMCHSLRHNLFPLFETITCDRLRREKYIQCGFCSSCILRRQALAAAGIKDKTRYLIPYARKSEPRHQVYWNKMSQQINIIETAVNTSEAWYQLSREYSGDLPDIVSEMTIKNIYKNHTLEDRLVRLYRTYVREWRKVSHLVSREMTLELGNYDLEEGRWQQMHLIK